MFAFTFRSRRVTSGSRPPALTTALVLAAASVALVLAGTGEVWALKAAGVFKEAVSIPGVEHYVSALEHNLIWLGITAVGLVLAVVAIMHLAGHSRAHDLLIKVLIGIGILACLSGLVA